METFRTTFERTLTASDSKQNIPFPIQVPPNTTQIRITFTYAPLVVTDIHNLLTLSVFDPSGWRGSGHRHGGRHEILLAGDRASPGFTAGPVQPGAWTVVVDAHVVMPGPPCVLRLEVAGTDEPAPGPATRWEAHHPASRGRGWYRGDLHAHTLHSDASWDVPDLVAFARSRQLDFATLSDHNTVSPLAQLDAAGGNDLLAIGGMELTTFWGHALALGLRDWVDWRVRPGERTMDQIAGEVAARGGLYIIAHPMSVGDPYCSGCDWGYPTFRPGPARVVEVWNSEWRSDSNNEAGLRLAWDWLNAGCRLALTAGTDNHGAEAEQMHYGFNVVYAEDLTEADVLRAVRAGRLYLSAGPRLELTAAAGAQPAMLGGALAVPAGAPVGVRAAWSGSPEGARLDWIVDGEPRDSLRAAGSGSKTWELHGGQARWCLLTLRAPDGQMLALTNPIYFDGRA